jgi:hypothetical protein
MPGAARHETWAMSRHDARQGVFGRVNRVLNLRRRGKCGHRRVLDVWLWWRLRELRLSIAVALLPERAGFKVNGGQHSAVCGRPYALSRQLLRG